MPLLPEEVATKTFPRRLWRGYDPREVDAFLQHVAADYTTAIHQVAAASAQRPTSYDGLGMEMAAIAQATRQAARDLQRTAERDAEQVSRRDRTAEAIGTGGCRAGAARDGRGAAAELRGRPAPATARRAGVPDARAGQRDRAAGRRAAIEGRVARPCQPARVAGQEPTRRRGIQDGLAIGTGRQ